MSPYNEISFEDDVFPKLLNNQLASCFFDKLVQ